MFRVKIFVPVQTFRRGPGPRAPAQLLPPCDIKFDRVKEYICTLKVEKLQIYADITQKKLRSTKILLRKYDKKIAH